MSRVEPQRAAEGADRSAKPDVPGAAAADGRVSAERLFARLDELGVVHRTVTHPPVFTVEESRALRGTLPGGHVKNLFLRDKKKRFWLVTAMEDRAIDLKDLRRRLGASGSLSFGSADLLLAMLGVEPGAVTPFAIINDRARQVAVGLDRRVLEHDPVNAHPLRNDMTTAVAPRDLLDFLAAEGHPPAILDLDAPR